MTSTELKYIEKLKKYNKHLINILDKNFILFHRSSFESEISALESEMEKELKDEIDNYSFSSDPHDD